MLGVHFSRNSTIFGPASPNPFASLPSSGAVGLTYVSPLHEFVAAAGAEPGPGVLYPVGEDQTPLSPWQPECSRGIGTVYYPGEGPVLFTQCLGGTGTSQLLELNVTTLVTDANITVPSGEPFDQCVVDGAPVLLSCVTYANELWTIDVSRQQVLGELHLPGAGGVGGGIWYDDSDGRLLAADPENSTLTIADPRNGSLDGGVPIPGVVTGLTEDSRLGRLFVAYCGPPFCLYPSGVAELDAATLTSILDVPAPFGGLYFSTVDAEHGEVDFSAGQAVLVLNESTNRWVSSSGAFPFPGYLAADPMNHLFAVAESDPGCSNVCIDFLGMSRNYTPQPPFSAVPSLGVAAPYDIGVTGILAGIGLLLASWRLSVDQDSVAAEQAIALVRSRQASHDPAQGEVPSPGDTR